MGGLCGFSNTVFDKQNSYISSDLSSLYGLNRTPVFENINTNQEKIQRYQNLINEVMTTFLLKILTSYA